MAIVLRLTDEERAELERRRAAGGFRSLNETVRAWLGPAPVPAWPSDVPTMTAPRTVVAPKGQGPTAGTKAETLIGRPTPARGSLLKKR